MRFSSGRPVVVGVLVAFAVILGQSAIVRAADPGKVKEGQPAPDVNLPATQIDKALPDQKDAKTLHLKDLEGKKNVVLYFFPKAMTGGWTLEACGFRDRIEQFAQLDTVVIGISTDKLEDQEKFTAKENLNFPLLADADLKITKIFGVQMPNLRYAQRATFVIDKKGIVRKIYPKADARKHPEEVLAYIKNNLADE